MIKKLLLAGMILLQTVCVAGAADVDGKWTMSQQGLNGGAPHVTTFDLKTEGAALTGTVTAPMGGRGSSAASVPVAITNGKVNGNSISFDVVRIFAGESVTTRYEATISGDTMQLKQTIDLGNGPRTVTGEAKRAVP